MDDYDRRQMMPRVYILGPVNTTRPGSECDQLLNVARMCEAADDLIAIGCIPTVPALSSFLHMMRPQTRSFWMAKSESDMLTCVACYRIAGDSPGADSDGLFAKRNSIPVFLGLVELAEHLREHYPFVHEAIDKGLPEYVSEVVAANSPLERDEEQRPIVHVLLDGLAMCDAQGKRSPALWPSGHSWLHLEQFNVKRVRDAGNTPCPGCVRAISVQA